MVRQRYTHITTHCRITKTANTINTHQLNSNPNNVTLLPSNGITRSETIKTKPSTPHTHFRVRITNLCSCKFIFSYELFCHATSRNTPATSTQQPTFFTIPIFFSNALHRRHPKNTCHISKACLDGTLKTTTLVMTTTKFSPKTFYLHLSTPHLKPSISSYLHWIYHVNFSKKLSTSLPTYAF